MAAYFKALAGARQVAPGPSTRNGFFPNLALSGLLRVRRRLNSGHLNIAEVEGVPDVQPRSGARVGSFRLHLS